jgi:hypothetical protein
MGWAYSSDGEKYVIISYIKYLGKQHLEERKWIGE